MNDKLEENIDSIKSDVGCFTFVVLVFVVLWFVSSIKNGSVQKLLAEQNNILKQILTYQAQK